MPTETFNPDADVESTSVDGRVTRSIASEPFSTIRAGAGTASLDSEASASVALIRASATTNEFQLIERGIFLFDTSSLPTGAVITSATLELYITTTSNALGNLSIVVVASTPATNTALINSDYGQLGSTALSDLIAINDITTSAYNTWTLNDSGLAAIDKAGITKLGTLVENDRSGSAPSWVSNAISGISSQFADGANAPKLNITFGAARANAFFI